MPEADLKKYVVDIVGLPLQAVHRALRKRVSTSSTFLNSEVNSENTAKRKKGRPPKVMTDFEKSALRRMIVNFHVTEKCHVTVKRLLAKAKSELNYEGGRESLRKTIRQMGFR